MRTICGLNCHYGGLDGPSPGVVGTGYTETFPHIQELAAAGSADELLKLFPAAARANIQARFQETLKRRQFRPDDVQAGREYVKSYITFMHYVEELHERQAEETKTKISRH